MSGTGGASASPSGHTPTVTLEPVGQWPIPPVQAPGVPQVTHVGGLSPLQVNPPPGELPAPWWFRETRAPRPQTVNVTTETSILLFVKDNPNRYPQVPTDADVAGGAFEIGFHNGTQIGFNFSGKLFESNVGNQSLNGSHDMDLGVPNQQLDVFYDSIPLTFAQPLITGIANSTIPAPMSFPNGTFAFTIAQFPDTGCGLHYMRIQYDALNYGNNGSYFASVIGDFRIHITCPTFLEIYVDHNPAIVGDQVTFFGTLKNDKLEPIPDREIQIYIENVGLLGQTGPGAFIDNVEFNGTTYVDDFEQNGTGWNQSGSGAVGAWAIGLSEQLPTSDPSGLGTGPLNLQGSRQMAGTGLTGFYGRGVDTWLKSPPVDMTNVSTPTPVLRFWFWHNISFDDYFEVGISIDGGLTCTAYNEVISDSGQLTYPGGYLLSLPDANGAGWDQRGISLAPFIGVPLVVACFHFKSQPYTAITNSAGSYQFTFKLPLSTPAGIHDVWSQFTKGIARDPLDDVTVATSPDTDLVYEFTPSIATIRFRVQRTTHFVFETEPTSKIGFRSQPLSVFAWLVDNMGEPLVTEEFIDNYVVKIYWDYTYSTQDAIRLLPPGDRPVNPDSGYVDIGYLVENQQDLGLHNATFVFEGSSYYVNSTGMDVYRIMAHTVVIWPDDAYRQVFRGRDALVNGSVRIFKNESRFDTGLGDPVPNELVHVVWEGTEIPEGQPGVLTNNSGGFRGTKNVSIDEPLGRKSVSLRYDGSDTYTAISSVTNWSVVTTTVIFFEETSVYKGSFLWFNGTMLDDRGIGVSNHTITIFFNQETIAILPTEPDGSYTFRHFVPTDLTVGNKEVIIRYYGDSIYLASQKTTNVTVKAHTQLLRTDHTQVVDRGQRLNVTGELFEIYEGGVRGAPVGLESVRIRIEDRPLTIETTNTEGKFTFRSNVPPELPVGEGRMVFEFAGSEFYDEATNETLVVIRGRAIVAFDLETVTLDGAPFIPANESMHQQETLQGIIRVTDELGNPVSSGDVRFFFAYSTGDAVEPIFVTAGPVDDLGRFEFNITFPDTDFVVGNRTLIAEYNGSFCATFVSARTLCLRPGTGNMTVDYQYQNPPPKPPDNLPWIIAGASIATILLGAVYFFWYAAKRRQLQRMQRIIRRAADRLVSGNPYAQVIFDAYRTLARYLQSNGYLRKDSETFREFEVALRQALPIDAKSMDEFLSILEEARYSDHEIGEVQRDRAIKALTAVTQSIDTMLQAGAAASGGVPQPVAPPPPLPEPVPDTGAQGGLPPPPEEPPQT
jgi:hypothetical protein